ncbi:hypothetical protein PVAND_004762 [Polypedilum vanderplanki]|uniref:Uncharacterized protein n=1 Tax=Polypedilum vanderplanki TaxID=319348 RepID=A0A9J6BY77_POLVA|nr:hypothetical protein PVAND_004762 [Polypedilum vanderplanki]
MFIKSFILLTFIAANCECYHNDFGIKGRTGQAIKSYGGYFPESTGYNDAYAQGTNYHRTVAPAYGWNLNYNQPSRTYGNRFGSTPSVPQLPATNLFQSNFIPPVYFPGTFTYPTYNSYPNLFPTYPNYIYNQRPVVSTDGTVINQQPSVINSGASNVPTILNQGEVLPTGNAGNVGIAAARPIAGNNVVRPIAGSNVVRPIAGTASNSGGNLGSSTGGISGNSGPSLGGSSGSSGSNLGGNFGSGGSNLGGSSGGSSLGSSGGSSLGNSGGSSTTSSGGGNSNTFSSGNFDSINSASNQNGIYAFNQNPFYQTQRPLHNQHGPPYPQQTIRPLPDQSAFESNNQQTVTEKPEDFSRFPSTSLLTENRRSEWTEEDEMKWQATTKKPYFENKAPVLGCTLSAAAVLGAMSALKVSTLLPLNVPSGKPILSCNATDMLQAQISLNGKNYDCYSSSIVVSCSSYDECETETLECDVNMNQMDAHSVTCTNGTLISNSHIVCESATLAADKNTLNCLYKDAKKTPETQRPISVIPLPTPAPVNEVFDENSVEDRAQLKDEENELKPQVKRAMDKVFPHDLLAMPSNMYLPSEQKLQPQISADLKKHVDNVFKVDLLASSKSNDDESTNTESPRLSAANNTERISTNSTRDNMQSRWEVNSNNKNATSGTKTKTSERFGGSDSQQHDLHDRLVFTD